MPKTDKPRNSYGLMRDMLNLTGYPAPRYPGRL